MARELDSAANKSVFGSHPSHSGAGDLGPRTALVASLGLALLLAALSALVMLPAARHLVSLRSGERAQATLHTSGACLAGQCQVRFEAGGRTVVADLPVGSGGGKSAVGTRLTVRYQPDNPRVVARQADVGGGGAAALTVVSGVASLFFLVLTIVAAVHLARRRRADRLR